MINIWDKIWLTSSPSLRKKLHCLRNSCDCFNINDPKFDILCEKEKCEFEHIVKKFISDLCPRPLTSPFAIPDAGWVMPNGVNYTVTSDGAEVYGVGWAIEWDSNALLTITFDCPTNLVISHIDDNTGINAAVQAWHTNWGFTTEINSNGSPITYTPGVVDLTGLTSIAWTNVTYTGWSTSGQTTTVDWGEFLLPWVTSVTVQWVSIESMQFVAVA